MASQVTKDDAPLNNRLTYIPRHCVLHLPLSPTFATGQLPSRYIRFGGKAGEGHAKVYFGRWVSWDEAPGLYSNLVDVGAVCVKFWDRSLEPEYRKAIEASNALSTIDGVETVRYWACGAADEVFYEATPGNQEKTFAILKGRRSLEPGEGFSLGFNWLIMDHYLPLSTVLETASLSKHLSLMRASLRAVWLLNSAGVLHRDLKTQNLVVSRELDGSPGNQVYIIDWETAEHVGPGSEKVMTCLGTGPFLPPFAIYIMIFEEIVKLRNRTKLQEWSVDQVEHWKNVINTATNSAGWTSFIDLSQISLSLLFELIARHGAETFVWPISSKMVDDILAFMRTDPGPSEKELGIFLSGVVRAAYVPMMIDRTYEKSLPETGRAEWVLLWEMLLYIPAIGAEVKGLDIFLGLANRETAFLSIESLEPIFQRLETIISNAEGNVIADNDVPSTSSPPGSSSSPSGHPPFSGSALAARKRQFLSLDSVMAPKRSTTGGGTAPSSSLSVPLSLLSLPKTSTYVFSWQMSEDRIRRLSSGNVIVPQDHKPGISVLELWVDAAEDSENTRFFFTADVTLKNGNPKSEKGQHIIYVCGHHLCNDKSQLADGSVIPAKFYRRPKMELHLETCIGTPQALKHMHYPGSIDDVSKEGWLDARKNRFLLSTTADSAT